MRSFAVWTRLSTLALILGVGSFSVNANAEDVNPFKSQFQGSSLDQIARSYGCKQRVGPFYTQRSAWESLRRYRARGFRTGNVWGSGGLYSYSSRRYYFYVFGPC